MAPTSTIFFIVIFLGVVCAHAQNKTKAFSKLKSESFQTPPERSVQGRWRKDPEKTKSEEWRFGLLGATAIGHYTGVGGVLHSSRSFFSVQQGTIPSYYHDLIASESGSSPYTRPVIIDSFQKSSVTRVDFNYKFASFPGWFFGGAISKADSQGKTPVDSALAAAIQQDVSMLAALLQALGMELEVEIKTKRLLAEVCGGYNWTITRDFYIGTSIGMMKAINVDLQFSAGLGELEETPIIKELIDGMEKKFQDSISRDVNGPIIGISLVYLF